MRPTVPINEPDRTGAPFILIGLGFCGVLSASLLVIATVLGGGLREGYNPIQQSISELYEVGAPYRNWLMVLFTAYHALVIPFAIGLHWGLPSAKRDWIGPLALGFAGLLGIPLGSYARCDAGCFGATTLQGQLHGILLLVTVPLIFTSMFAVSCRLWQHPKWRSLAYYSLATAACGVAFGLGMMPFIRGAYAGLLERVSVAIILQWYVLMGISLMSIPWQRHTAKFKRQNLCRRANSDIQL